MLFGLKYNIILLVILRVKFLEVVNFIKLFLLLNTIYPVLFTFFFLFILLSLCKFWLLKLRLSKLGLLALLLQRIELLFNFWLFTDLVIKIFNRANLGIFCWNLHIRTIRIIINRIVYFMFIIIFFSFTWDIKIWIRASVPRILLFIILGKSRFFYGNWFLFIHWYFIFKCWIIYLLLPYFYAIWSRLLEFIESWLFHRNILVLVFHLLNSLHTIIGV